MVLMVGGSFIAALFVCLNSWGITRKNYIACYKASLRLPVFVSYVSISKNLLRQVLLTVYI